MTGGYCFSIRYAFVCVTNSVVCFQFQWQVGTTAVNFSTPTPLSSPPLLLSPHKINQGQIGKEDRKLQQANPSEEEVKIPPPTTLNTQHTLSYSGVSTPQRNIVALPRISTNSMTKVRRHSSSPQFDTPMNDGYVWSCSL